MFIGCGEEWDSMRLINPQLGVAAYHYDKIIGVTPGKTYSLSYTQGLIVYYGGNLNSMEPEVLDY